MRPETIEAAAALLAEAAATGRRVRIGEDLSTAGLDRVLEHEAGDLTCTVEAGIRLSTLRRLLAERSLGPLVSVSASVRWWRSFEYFAEPGRGTLERDAGGVLLTQAIHTLDLLLDLVGPVRRLTAQVRNSGLRRIDTEDIACAMVEYENGAIGTLDATTTAYPGYPERIEIAGHAGSALLEAERLSVSRHDAPPLLVEGSTSGGGGADPMAFSHAAHARLWSDFLGAVQAGRQPLASARSALRVHALIDTMLASSREGRTLEAPAAG